MCAIAGILNLDTTDKIDERILETMRRRGPDGNGFFEERGIKLFHTRLAIIDPDGGKQPMTTEWGAEKFTIVYNGELYNTSELRADLINLGHTFEGHSDTEVLLHAYAEWGRDALNKLNGIYAFAIWEHKRRRLFLARDRMGVKPLFYKEHDNGFLFASEIKTILTYPTVMAQLNAEGVAQILLLGPGRIPGSGIFRGVLELEPGCCGYYENGKFCWERYWTLKDREHSESFEETVDHVRYLVLDAIKRQMVSDVPIGTFLSGGLDSSLISSIISGEMKRTAKRLITFSVDYENNDKYFVAGKFQPNSDSHYIEAMCQYLGCDNIKTLLSARELADALDASTDARDLPGMADVDFSLLAFCKRIKSHVKVALSGECADEIFGGYPWFRDPEVRAVEGFPWAQNVQQRTSLLLEGGTKASEFVSDLYHDSVNQADVLPDTKPLEKRMKEMSYLNQRWFMQTLLDRKDRMSMYSGLEVRVPFCDHRIAQYLYGVPWEFKDYQGREKGLLRLAMQDVLPDEVLWRKKSPYPKTFDPEYTQIVREKLAKVLADPASPLLSLVDKDALVALIEKEQVWPWYGQLMKTPQTIAYMLQIDYWLRKYNVDIL